MKIVQLLTLSSILLLPLVKGPFCLSDKLFDGAAEGVYNQIFVETDLAEEGLADSITTVSAAVSAADSTAAVSAAASAALVPPFDFPIVLSGNFGELRSNHFHGGLDFKTQGAVNKPVRAQADGYISRFRVSHGSGYVLDVVYHNGLSAIYRHLNGFMGEAARRIKELQYEQESWEVELKVEPDEYPVKAGEVMALSGNTGYSFGPHLHLDLFETATGDYIDPLPYFAGQIHDHTAPRAQGLLLFPRRGEGVVMGDTKARRLPLQPKQTITAWGWIGAGIKAYDYMDGAHNRLGVHTVTLQVDGREVFRSVVNRFSDAEQRYINAWTDGPYMRSVIDPGNRLRLLQAADSQRGWVRIDEERPYHFLYTLTDALGNQSQVRFSVQGRRCEIPEADQGNRLLKWDETNVVQQPGLLLVIPRGMLYDDVPLHTAVMTDSTQLAYTYQLHDEPLPLHGPCHLRIALRQPLPQQVDTTKLYVARVGKHGHLSSVGGSYRQGEMVASVRQLGSYTVAVDTVPPVITPINRQLWLRQGRIEFAVKDGATGVASYLGTIDGHYALFGKPNLVNGRIVYQIDYQRIARGQRHRLKFTATDACGNQSSYETHF